MKTIGAKDTSSGKGNPVKPRVKQAVAKVKQTAKQAFDTVGKKPTSPYIDTKSNAAENLYEGDPGANQAPAQDPQQQAVPQQQTADQQQAPRAKK